MKKILFALTIMFAVLAIDANGQGFTEFQTISKENVNIILNQRLSDICHFDVVRLAGPPKAV